MKMTPEQMKQQQDEYAAAGAEPDAVKNDPTDDEVFGLDEPAADEKAEGESPDEDAAETPAAEAAEDATAEGGEAAGETPEEAKGDAPGVPEGDARDADEIPQAPAEDNEPAQEAAAEPANDAEPAADVEKERQRLKSWEGRLKKLQAELESKAPVQEPAAEEALEEVVEQSAASGDAPMAEEAAQVAEQVESGAMTVDQAIKQLADDFGEDFVKMIEMIASSKAMEAGSSVAKEQVGQIGKAVEDIIADITDSKAKAHFEKIADKYPDFDTIGRSEGFAAFVNGMGEEAKTEALRIINTGSAAEIIDLLDAYKETQAGESAKELAAEEKPASDPVVEQQMDAAEGVRSSGMKLPEQPPASSSSYEEAWKEFA